MNFLGSRSFRPQLWMMTILVGALVGLAPVPAPRPTYAFWNRGLTADPEPLTGAAFSFRDHGFDEPGTTVAAVRFQPPAVTVYTPPADPGPIPPAS